MKPLLGNGNSFQQPPALLHTKMLPQTKKEPSRGYDNYLKQLHPSRSMTRRSCYECPGRLPYPASSTFLIVTAHAQALHPEQSHSPPPKCLSVRCRGVKHATPGPPKRVCEQQTRALCAAQPHLLWEKKLIQNTLKHMVTRRRQ